MERPFRTATAFQFRCGRNEIVASVIPLQVSIHSCRCSHQLSASSTSPTGTLSRQQNRTGVAFLSLVFLSDSSQHRMPISLNPASQTSSTECLLPRGPHLTPPVSDHSLNDVPFTPREDDRISLSMKRKRRHLHSLRPKPLPRGFRRSQQDVTESSRRRRKKGKKSFRTANLQRSISLPLLQPRFTHGSVELLCNTNTQQRPRRWTIPSKAASTRGLAPILPLIPREEKGDSWGTTLLQSPAMITLRRATTTGNSRRMSLTTFPTPKFSRAGSGFFSSVMSSITGTEAGMSNSPPSLSLQCDGRQRTQQASISSTEAWPSLSTIAPVVCTEIIMMEPSAPNSAPGQKINRLRRCSTRIVTNDNVYEILWDEDSSSSSSQGMTMPIVGRVPSAESRRSSAVDVLQSQLSRASTRRSSLPSPLTRDEGDLRDDENASEDRSDADMNSPSAMLPGGQLSYNFPPFQISPKEKWKSCANQSLGQDILRERPSPYSDDKNGSVPPCGGGLDTDTDRSCPDTSAKSGDEGSNGSLRSTKPVTRKHCARVIDVRTHMKLGTQQKGKWRPRPNPKVFNDANSLSNDPGKKGCKDSGKAPRLCTSASPSN